MVRSNKICTAIIAMLSLLLLAVPSLIEAGPPMKQHPPRIRLGATEFTPSKGERPTIPSGLAVSGYPEGQSGYYIIQFAGPIQQSWKE